jgi:hypothetical protein
MRSFSLSWRSDEVIMLLLSAIALFSPDRVNLIHQSGNGISQSLIKYLMIG